MINWFPKMYDDELLYSVVARYKRRSGIVLKKSIMEDFYNKNTGMFQILFPIHLEKMSEMLPINSKITSEQLALNHTMYPYYTKLLPKDIADDIFDSMLNGDNKAIMIKARLHNGEMTGNRYLKYCPLCVKEDMKNLGESYWRREHQVIGVWFCYKHRIQLKESDIVTSKTNNRYICVEDVKETKERVIDENFFKYNITYIELVKELKIEYKEINLQSINSFYLYKLKELNLTTDSGQVRIKELSKRFLQYYPKEYLQLMQSSIEKIDDQKNWLSKFFSKKHNKIILRHLLVLQFLNSSVNEIINFNKDICFNKSTYKKSGKRKYDLEQRKLQWLEIIKNNPDKSKTELAKISPALRNYIYKYDKEWYYKVTPKNTKRRGKQLIDWKEKDNEMCAKVKLAVEKLYNREGKPVRVCTLSIKKELSNEINCTNPKLIKTNELINKLTEDKESFRKRKIIWAYKELLKNQEKISVNKIKKKAGLGNLRTDDIKEVIEKVILEKNILYEVI